LILILWFISFTLNLRSVPFGAMVVVVIDNVSQNVRQLQQLLARPCTTIQPYIFIL